MKKVLIYLFISLFFTTILISQVKNPLDIEGVWQNNQRQIQFDYQQSKINLRLRTFYGLWLDKPYEIKFSDLEVMPLVYNDELYISYWKNNSENINLFIPQSNIQDISIDEQKKSESIYAYYFEKDENHDLLQNNENFLLNKVIKIRYWLTNSIPNDEKAYIKLNDETEIQIDKFIVIGKSVYTSVTGRGTNVRNIQYENIEEKYPNKKFISIDDVNFLVLNKPYLKKIDKED